MVFEIYEGNMGKLREKLAKIEKKCAKYGCAFRFEETGEVFHEVKGEDGNVYTVRFVLVDVEGVAKVNGWQFVGTLEHTGNGNVVRMAVDGLEIPERFYSCAPYCEHCKTRRFRKDTYVVFNEETGEFKQVGKNCLMDFTNGLSAEMAASVERFIHEVEEAHDAYSGIAWEHWYDVREMVTYAAECVDKFGWVSRQSYGEATAARAFRYWEYDHGRLWSKLIEVTEKEIAEVGFDASHAEEMAGLVIDWAKTQEKDGSYFNNLRVLAGNEMCRYRDIGILASAVIAYQKEMKIAAECKAREDANKEKAAKSEYVGEVGKRSVFDVVSGRCVSSWETQFGMTWLYEFVDANGNVLMWYASSPIDDDVQFPRQIKGTVKAFKEYNGIKQTVLTRCKVA